jgi:hypothetical protein
VRSHGLSDQLSDRHAPVFGFFLQSARQIVVEPNLDWIAKSFRPRALIHFALPA